MERTSLVFILCLIIKIGTSVKENAIPEKSSDNGTQNYLIDTFIMLLEKHYSSTLSQKSLESLSTMIKNLPPEVLQEGMKYMLPMLLEQSARDQDLFSSILKDETNPFLLAVTLGLKHIGKGLSGIFSQLENHKDVLNFQVSTPSAEDGSHHHQPGEDINFANSEDGMFMFSCCPSDVCCAQSIFHNHFYV